MSCHFSAGNYLSWSLSAELGANKKNPVSTWKHSFSLPGTLRLQPRMCGDVAYEDLNWYLLSGCSKQSFLRPDGLVLHVCELLQIQPLKFSSAQFCLSCFQTSLYVSHLTLRKNQGSSLPQHSTSPKEVSLITFYLPIASHPSNPLLSELLPIFLLRPSPVQLQYFPSHWFTHPFMQQRVVPLYSDGSGWTFRGRGRHQKY